MQSLLHTQNEEIKQLKIDLNTTQTQLKEEKKKVNSLKRQNQRLKLNLTVKKRITKRKQKKNFSQSHVNTQSKKIQQLEQFVNTLFAPSFQNDDNNLEKKEELIQGFMKYFKKTSRVTKRYYCENRKWKIIG